MDNRLSGIKVLIWDFDGTLYQPNELLMKAVRQAEYKTIKNHTGWSEKKIFQEFQKLYKVKYLSATETVAKISQISVSTAAVELEEYFDRRKFLKRDEKLINLFKRLNKFRHFILANGSRIKLAETMVKLGLAKNQFEEIITSEISGENKPHENGFKYILKLTGLPAEAHLMIGDRILVDLVPAKKLGMKTCLVWSSETKNPDADIIVPTVYDVGEILL